MTARDDIREGMEVIGADGVHVGTIDRIEEHRIKLTRKDSGQGSHEGHHHYLGIGLVAGRGGRQGAALRQRRCRRRHGRGGGGRRRLT